MNKYKEIYDLALDLLDKTNRTFTDVTPHEKETLYILLTGFINNVNSILVKSYTNADNQPSSTQKTGTSD
jgi:hypothetical protein